MNKKPLTIPQIIILNLIPFFIPIAFLITPLYTFTRLKQKKVGWLFAGAEVLVFVLSLMLFNPAEANRGELYAILVLMGPVVIIHLVSFYLTISLYRKIMAQN